MSTQLKIAEVDEYRVTALCKWKSAYVSPRKGENKKEGKFSFGLVVIDNVQTNVDGSHMFINC